MTDDPVKRRVDAAEAEAKRFLARVKAWRLNADQEHIWMGCQHSAAMKRASMDLSRSLSQLRKGSRA